MKKYIRTKDGIYKYADYLGIFNGKRYALMDDAKGNRITMCQEPEELYQTADIIEELCDMFILLNEDNGRHKICLPYEIDLRTSVYEGLGAIHQKIYSAIWTDKGLIYVAKMNEKGDFELL